MSKTKAIAKTWTLAIIIIVIALGAAGAYYYSIRAPTQQPKAAPVKIGAVLPLSGPLAQPGSDVRQGLELAVREINENGGVKSLGGANITVVYADSGSRPEQGAAEAERLITDEKVTAIIGAYASALTKTVSEVCERYSVPCITGISTSVTLTQRGYKWFFRTTPHDNQFAPQHVEFANWLNQKYNKTISAVAIIHEDTDFGTASKDAWQAAFSGAGFPIVKIVSYHAATVTSLTSEVATLQATNPDLLLAASYANDALLLLQAMKTLNFNPKVFLGQDSGFIQPSYTQQVGKDGYYVASREVFANDLAQAIPKLAQVSQRYQTLYKVGLNGESAREYTATWVVYYALEAAGKTARPANLEAFRTAIRDGLVNLKLTSDQLIMPWKGVQFDSTGQNILGNGIIVQMMPDDGKYHTVYPESVAIKPLIFPFPSWTSRT